MGKWLGILSVVISCAAVALVITNRGVERKGPAEMAREDKTETPAERGAQDRDSADLRGRVASLELTVSNLMRRISALEKAPAQRAGEPGSAAEQDQKQVAQLRSEVDALLAGEALSSEAGRKRFKEMVRTVQDEVFQERGKERFNAFEKDRNDRLKKFADDAKLSNTQEQQVKTILDSESQQRRALMEQMRSGQGQAQGQVDIRTTMRNLRESTDQAAKGILSQEQFTQYQQMRQEERRGPWGGPPGGMPLQ
ncbi:MAG: hypothetical protein WC889_18675 [Myxococcota bacterium]|jgi:hypothetical protein